MKTAATPKNPISDSARIGRRKSAAKGIARASKGSISYENALRWLGEKGAFEDWTDYDADVGRPINAEGLAERMAAETAAAETSAPPELALPDGEEE